jgi:undecaprenyl diphosphate synthase
MPQSESPRPEHLPRHVAIILDGNGRWAECRGRPRPEGHVAGAAAVRRTVEAARELGIRILTLYAFSSDNWRRPGVEVLALLSLLVDFLDAERHRCREQGIRLSLVGRRDRLPGRVVTSIDRAERETAAGRDMELRVAVDYSARTEIARAASRLRPGPGDPEAELARLLGGPDVDLLIRAGGEQRLSDFLLWECAYAELVFLPVLWPEFSRGDLLEALGEYARRDRRFGRVTAAAV